jgi:hypothetical protein
VQGLRTRPEPQGRPANSSGMRQAQMPSTEVMMRVAVRKKG